ncbi:MAG: 2-C-methyl-D-erythritol 4-phosphate cytidylyltransferase [Solirubrobacteraceae bacterium]|jgi:2-C-methyl-D-erythritol 4-phosphate cytidylyltransferase|nr:2-C-methyl-D-erythritol 4-phosphate cytidylyltransferase [Solirubrobacteraceae bacterium]
MAVALIVAAGSGERLGAGRPKALVELAGRPLVQWSIDAMREVAEVERIVLALPADAEAPTGVTAVEGGPVRSDSVRRALAAAGAGDPIVVHDAARPLLTPALVRSVLAALAADEHADAAIAATRVTDTVKRVDEAGSVLETLDRDRLRAVQTPQVFRRAALARALDASAEELARATDDAWLVEQAGGRVIVVESSAENLKVTTALDLQVAELLIAARRGRGS